MLQWYRTKRVVVFKDIYVKFPKVYHKSQQSNKRSEQGGCDVWASAACLQNQWPRQPRRLTRRTRLLRAMGYARQPAFAACDGIRPTARHIRGMGENTPDSLTREKAFVRLRFLLRLQIQELIV